MQTLTSSFCCDSHYDRTKGLRKRDIELKVGSSQKHSNGVNISLEIL